MFDKIILGLNNILSHTQLVTLMRDIGSKCYAVKVQDLAEEMGISFGHRLKQLGAKRVWDDRKIHDTGDTVERAVLAKQKQGVDIVSVFAQVGMEGLLRANEIPGIQVYVISKITSLSNEQLKESYGFQDPFTLLSLGAQLAILSGSRGIVAPGPDLPRLLSEPYFTDTGLEIIVPGTRSPGVAAKSQKQVITPKEAMQNGATRLVIASEITEARDPQETATNIVKNL